MKLLINDGDIINDVDGMLFDQQETYKFTDAKNGAPFYYIWILAPQMDEPDKKDENI